MSISANRLLAVFRGPEPSKDTQIAILRGTLAYARQIIEDETDGSWKAQRLARIDAALKETE